MEKIIIKNNCDFNEYSTKFFVRVSVRQKVSDYFRARGYDVEFNDSICGDSYVEIICSSALSRSDKNYLLNIYQRGFGKNVAFIGSDKRFFELVDDYMPAVI